MPAPTTMVTWTSPRTPGTGGTVRLVVQAVVAGSHPGPITHTSGDTLAQYEFSQSISPELLISFPIPQMGPGWTDANGVAVDAWAWSVTMVATSADGMGESVVSRSVQPLLGTPTLSLDETTDRAAAAAPAVQQATAVAAAAAATADGKAVAAGNAATAAQTLATSADKRTTTATVAPSSGDVTGRPDGATWEVVNSSGVVTSRWVLRSGAWAQTALQGSTTLATSSTTLDRLSTGVVSNLQVDPNFRSDLKWNDPAAYVSVLYSVTTPYPPDLVVSTVSTSGARRLRFAAPPNTSVDRSIYLDFVPLAGTRYRVQFYTRLGSGTPIPLYLLRLQVGWDQLGGTPGEVIDVYAQGITENTTGEITTAGWNMVWFEFDIPVNVFTYGFFAKLIVPNNSTFRTSVLDITSLKVWDMIPMRRINWSTEDTGWIPFVLASGWTAAAGWPSPAYRVKFGVVYLRGRLNATAAAGVTIATLPKLATPPPSANDGSGAPNGDVYVFPADAVGYARVAMYTAANTSTFIGQLFLAGKSGAVSNLSLSALTYLND